MKYEENEQTVYTLSQKSKRGFHTTIITINAPDPDQSWPECFWKCSFPFDLSKHNTRACYRGFIACVKI